MTHVLFVCTGNICRSALAERYATRRTRDMDWFWTYSSAGTGALAGSPMDPPMAAQAQARGADPTGFVARQVDDRILAEADLILTMETSHRDFLLTEHPALAWRTLTLGQLDASLRELSRSIRGPESLQQVLDSRPRCRSRHDIPDPYRRGDRAMAQAADAITAALDRILPRVF